MSEASGWLDGSVWVSAFDETPEASARSSMKFVKVATVGGYLTDISISMIMVELKRRDLKIVKR